MPAMRIIVIGAGIVGLTSAWWLTRDPMKERIELYRGFLSGAHETLRPTMPA